MKRNIIILAVIVVTAATGFMTVQAFNPEPAAVQTKPAATEPKEVKTPEIKESTEIQPSERPQEAPQIVESNTVPSQPAAQPAPSQEKLEGGHIPFTSKPVTAGDPESYVDTVGQCPFYEMAGEKGCVPPPDLECNSDWSICKLKETNQ